MHAIQARDYQGAAVDSLFNYFMESAKKQVASPVWLQANPLVAMPTGTGKSVVIALFAHRVYQAFPTERMMVLTHVKELIEQNFQKLLQHWPTAPAGVYSAGLGRKDTQHKIIFAGIASAAKQAALFGHIGIVIIDEAHMVSPKDQTMYQRFLAELRKVNPALKVIGLTATPWRLGHGKITEGGLFTDVCFDLTTVNAFNWLLAEGYLCPLVPRPTTARIKTDGIHMRGGEFVESEVHAAVSADGVLEACIEETIALGGDRRSWLLFCAGTKNAHLTAQALNRRGIECEVVDKDTSNEDRRRIIKDLRSGKLRAVANNNVLTTGFDHPGLDLIVMLRPTASAVLWVQMLGRGTRPLYAPGYNLATAEGRLAAMAASPKQNCLVLDFAGNAPRLGPINDPLIPKRKGETQGEAPIRICPACTTYNHASARHCTFCGCEFPQHGPKLNETAGTDDLIKVNMPVVEVFGVDHVTYTAYNKLGKPPSMRVTYYCGARAFSEYVCPEHNDPMSPKRARAWFKDRRINPECPIPALTADMLRLTEYLRAPTHLRVHTNKQYPEIVGACFDGTAFGTQDASAYTPSTEVAPMFVANTPRKAAKAPAPPPPVTGFDDMDDDIPF